MCIIILNFIEISRTVFEISRCFPFSKWLLSAIWDFWPTILSVAPLAQCVVCRLWRFVLWRNGTSNSAFTLATCCYTSCRHIFVLMTSSVRCCYAPRRLVAAHVASVKALLGCVFGPLLDIEFCTSGIGMRYVNWTCIAEKAEVASGRGIVYMTRNSIFEFDVRSPDITLPRLAALLFLPLS